MSQQDSSHGHAEEYERVRVPDSALKGPRKFWGLFAGEHVAGTEFMIGPLFLVNGVCALDLFLGLLLGNFLAVLSWRFVCAPCATRLRYTLYYQLERVAGARFTQVYNVANGLLFCVLAGAMITVSATAVGLPLGMSMPQLGDTLPNGPLWIVVVAVIGAVITAVAAGGYDKVAEFSNRIAPWMIAVFFACGAIALAQLGAASPAEFWKAATTEIWPGRPLQGTGFSFWHVVFFAWLCNSPWHIGLSDASLFRYARKASYGWASLAGMYVGHFMAWIAASLLYAVVLRSPEAQAQLAQGAAPAVAPGPMAWNAAGLAGILCVIAAGWTTANPTIYRAGLAFQGLFPRSSRYRFTLLAGGLATVAGIFPGVAMKLLDFVGFFGCMIAPVGAILLADHWLARRAGFDPEWAVRTGRNLDPAALGAWILAAGGAAIAIFGFGWFGSFVTLPAWLAAGGCYLLLARVLRPEARA
jgi:nucleobase:cation symporter-1, NCS1 family